MTLLTRLALRRRSLTLLTVALLLAGGWYSVTRLAQELFPSLDAPFLTVVATQPGSGPTALASDVVEPIEEAIDGAEGVESVTSTARDGAATVVVSYDYGEDMAERESEVIERLEAVALPDGAGYRVERAAPGDGAVYAVAVSGDDLDAADAYVDERLRPALEAADGVAAVEVTGGSERELVVELDPDLLAESGVGVTDVAAAVTAANLDVAVGDVVDGGTALPVTVTGVAGTVEQVEAVELTPRSQGGEAGGSDPVAGAAGGGDPAAGAAAGGGAAAPAAEPEPLRVGDLGTVTLVEQGDDASISRLDGLPAITLEVLAEQGANTVEVVDAAVAAVDATDPPDLTDVTEVVNQAPEIEENISALSRDAAVGIGLLVVILLLFLRSVRPTLVSGVSIPTSLAVAAVLMLYQDITLNIITIGALSVAAARTIDDSIVVLENTHRLMEAGVERTRAVVEGTGQVVGAITASTITTVCVFLPLALIGGLIGEVFLGFALTVTYALLASLLVALTVVPVLAHLLLRPRPSDTAIQAADRPLVRSYTRPLRWALRHRWLTVGMAVVLLGGALTSLTRIPTTLFPESDASSLAVTIDTPAGQAVATTAEEVTGFEERVARIDGVDRYTTSIGAEPDGFTALDGDAATARVTVALEDDADPDEVTTELAEALEASGLIGAVVEAGGGTLDSSSLAVDVLGDDYEAVTAAAAQVRDALGELDGIESLESNADSDRPEIAVELDQEALAERGLSAEAVAGLVRAALNGAGAGEVSVDGESAAVEVGLDPAATAGAGALTDLALSADTTLGDVATVTEVDRPSSVTRTDGQRSASVTGVIAADDTGAVNSDVRQALDDLDLPDGVSTEIGGVTAQQQDSFSALGIAMLVAVAVVYLVLVATFGSLLTPLVILLALPLAAVGALPALLVTGYPLDLPALIGMLMLVGIVVNNAIVLLDYVERRKREGLSTRDALVEGGQVRLRPILITATVTVGALSPLAAGLSEGAILSAGLATVVIGGLLSSTLLTLVVVPVVYSLVDGVRGSGSGRARRRAAPPAPHGGDSSGSEGDGQSGEAGRSEGDGQSEGAGQLDGAGRRELAGTVAGTTDGTRS